MHDMQKVVVRNLDGNALYPLGGVENNQLGWKAGSMVWMAAACWYLGTHRVKGSRRILEMLPVGLSTTVPGMFYDMPHGIKFIPPKSLFGRH